MTEQNKILLEQLIESSDYPELLRELIEELKTPIGITPTD